jgi:hypothetical protein
MVVQVDVQCQRGEENGAQILVVVVVGEVFSLICMASYTVLSRLVGGLGWQ